MPFYFKTSIFKNIFTKVFVPSIYLSDADTIDRLHLNIICIRLSQALLLQRSDPINLSSTNHPWVIPISIAAGVPIKHRNHILIVAVATSREASQRLYSYLTLRTSIWVKRTSQKTITTLVEISYSSSTSRPSTTKRPQQAQKPTR